MCCGASRHGPANGHHSDGFVSGCQSDDASYPRIAGMNERPLEHFNGERIFMAGPEALRVVQ